jgi:hypothetical protein
VRTSGAVARPRRGLCREGNKGCNSTTSRRGVAFQTVCKGQEELADDTSVRRQVICLSRGGVWCEQQQRMDCTNDLRYSVQEGNRS